MATRRCTLVRRRREKRTPVQSTTRHFLLLTTRLVEHQGASPPPPRPRMQVCTYNYATGQRDGVQISCYGVKSRSLMTALKPSRRGSMCVLKPPLCFCSLMHLIFLIFFFRPAHDNDDDSSQPKGAVMSRKRDDKRWQKESTFCLFFRAIVSIYVSKAAKARHAKSGDTKERGGRGKGRGGGLRASGEGWCITRWH